MPKQTKTKPKTCGNCALYVFDCEDKYGRFRYKCRFSNNRTVAKMYACLLWQPP